MIRLILFLVVSVMAAGGTSMAENTSTYSVDTVPIQIMRERAPDDVTTLSAAEIYDYPPGFSAFVTAVTEHVVASLAREKLCLDNAESKKRSLLQFAPWPIVSNHLAPVPPLETGPIGVCQISSPWIDITIERKPVPWVRAIIRYNAHQLLADQAVLEGARNVPPGVAMPLTQSEFEQYAFEYSDSTTRINPAKKPIEERLPPDLLWLFRRARQNMRGPFSDMARVAMGKAMATGADGYTKIVIALIDQCFSSEGVEVQYNNILDVADLIPLEQYKIVTPIR